MATIQELEQELSTLRASHAEVLAKASTRKDRIESLQSEIAALKLQLSEQQTSHEADKANTNAFVRKHFVDGVAEELANDISIAPKLILPYILPRLTTDSTNGQPRTVVLDTDGKPTDLNIADLKKELLTNKDLSHILIGSKASGGGATGAGGSRASIGQQRETKKSTVDTKLALQLGLR